MPAAGLAAPPGAALAGAPAGVPAAPPAPQGIDSLLVEVGSLEKWSVNAEADYFQSGAHAPLQPPSTSLLANLLSHQIYLPTSRNPVNKS